MKLAMIGSGYVGLVSGACFADFGHEVVCVDKDAKKIDDLNNNIMPIYEPGLANLVKRNVDGERLSFSTDLASSIKDCDAIFIAVGTPSRRGDGHADLSYVYAASEELADSIVKRTVVITKSTVPVGTGDEVEHILDPGGGQSHGLLRDPQHLAAGAARVLGGGVEEDADLAARVGQVRVPAAQDGRGARRGRGEAGQDAQRGGLAGTVGAEEPGHAPGQGGERDVVDGEVLAVALGQLEEFDHGTEPGVGRGPGTSGSDSDPAPGPTPRRP